MGSYCDDYYSGRVKTEEGEDGRFWQGSIKDDVSLLNEPIQAVEVKQEEDIGKFRHEEVDEFLGVVEMKD